MSDLAATNCGGGCSCNEGGCGSILWIILLLCCCGGNGCGLNSGNGWEMTAAFGLSCFSSAAADAETATVTDSAAANKNAHGF